MAKYHQRENNENERSNRKLEIMKAIGEEMKAKAVENQWPAICEAEGVKSKHRSVEKWNVVSMKNISEMKWRKWK